MSAEPQVVISESDSTRRLVRLGRARQNLRTIDFRAAAPRSWWEHVFAKFELSNRDDQTAEACAQLTKALADISERDWENVARSTALALAEKMWQEHRADIPERHRHLYAPVLLDYLDDVAGKVEVGLTAATLYVENVRGQPAGMIAVREEPELSNRLKHSEICRYIRLEVERYDTVATDREFLTQKSIDPSDGSPQLIVQHKRSGLRARFHLQPDGIGTVYSKPYGSGGVPSIDPDRPGDLDWELHAGLGIGTQIYLEGAKQAPDQRWASSVLSNHSCGLRRRLHLGDPHRWQGPCDWCVATVPDWRSSTPDAFESHPILRTE